MNGDVNCYKVHDAAPIGGPILIQIQRSSEVPNDPLEPIIISTPRRRRRKPKRRLKVGMWVWRAGVLAVVLGVGSAALVRAVEPYAMRHRQKMETADLKEELAKAQEQNQTLKRQIERLRSGQGLELEARKLGYIKTGEIPLKISYEKAPK